MGAGQSAAAHVVLDKHACAPGELVTGAVVFNTIAPVPYHVVLLKFVGKERTHWEVKHRDKNGTSTSKYGGKARIIQAEMPLLTGPGTLSVGGHRLPFALQLPQGLPASAALKRGEAKGSITYKIKCFVDQAGLFAADFKAGAKLDLLPRPPREPRPLRAAGEDAVVCCCGLCCGGCCCSKGGVALAVEAPADTFEAGQSINVKAKVDNRSSESLQLSVSLLCTLRLKAMGLLGDSSWQEQHVVMKQPLLAGGGEATAGGAQRQRQQQQAGAGAVVAAGGGGSYHAALPLSPELQPSVVAGTQLLQHWYELRVTAAAPGCCTADAKLSAPVLLAPSPAALQQRAAARDAPPPPRPPAGWAPVDYDAAAFVIARDGLAARVRMEQLKGAAGGGAASGIVLVGGRGDADGQSWGSGVGESSALGGGGAAAAAGLIPAYSSGSAAPGGAPAQCYPAFAPPPPPPALALAAVGTPAYPAIGGAGAPGAAAAAPAGGMQVPGPHLLPQQAPGW